MNLLMRPICTLISLNHLSSHNQIFRPTFTARGLLQPPWSFDFSMEFACEIIHGYVFGVKEFNVDNHNFLSISSYPETQGHFPCSWLWSYSMTFHFKVVEWLQAFIHRFSNFLTPKNTDIDTDNTFLACF